MSVVPLRGFQPAGIATCVRYISEDLDCGAPATWHIWWAGGDVVSPACDEHHDEAVSRGWDMKDAHPFGGVCGMPGTIWHYSVDGEHGHCAFDLDADEVLSERVDTPEEVLV
jgi:hypothetical protein